MTKRAGGRRARYAILLLRSSCVVDTDENGLFNVSFYHMSFSVLQKNEKKNSVVVLFACFRFLDLSSKNPTKKEINSKNNFQPLSRAITSERNACSALFIFFCTTFSIPHPDHKTAGWAIFGEPINCKSGKTPRTIEYKIPRWFCLFFLGLVLFFYFNRRTMIDRLILIPTAKLW